MHGASMRRRVVEAFPLPGVGEIERVVKGLINRLKAAGYENDQCESLVRRLDRLIAIANSCNELENFNEISSKLQDSKSRFETKLKPDSRLPAAFRAQDRLRACEDLNRELTNIMENAQFQLLTRNLKMLTEVTAHLNRRSIMENFEVIRECDLSFDDAEPPTSRHLDEVLSVEAGEIKLLPGPIDSHCRLGRLGRLRVGYISFSAQSDHAAAAERAEEELKQLSRIRHPNLPLIVGVTRGYDGLNGFVTATEGIPIKRFFERSIPGSVLVRCIKGLWDAIHFFWESRISHGLEWDGVGITVALNGHVTVLPSSNGMGSIPPEWAADPVTNLVLRVCRRGMVGPSGPAGRIRVLFDSLTSLGQSHLTELQLLKLLVDCEFNPLEIHHYWHSTTVPPFTVCDGDIGYILGKENEGEKWETLEACSDTKTETKSDERNMYCPGRCKWQEMPGIHAEYHTWVIDCHHWSTGSPSTYSRKATRWGDVMKRAKSVAEQHNVELDHVSYVVLAFLQVSVQRPGLPTQSFPKYRLYFHRSRLSRPSPQEFCGFFSTSPDPCAPSTGLEDLGWTCYYRLYYRTMRIGDDWGRQYRRSLQAGIATIPGGYPGAHIEELSDDESE